jgi:hypothetical protein
MDASPLLWVLDSLLVEPGFVVRLGTYAIYAQIPFSFLSSPPRLSFVLLPLSASSYSSPLYLETPYSCSCFRCRSLKQLFFSHPFYFFNAHLHSYFDYVVFYSSCLTKIHHNHVINAVDHTQVYFGYKYLQF